MGCLVVGPKRACRLRKSLIVLSKLMSAASFAVPAFGSGVDVGPDTTPANPSTWNLVGGGNWFTSANWLNGIPNAVGATADLFRNPGITSAATISLDSNATLGTLDFNNPFSYTISPNTGSESLTFDNGSAQAAILDQAGNHTISTPVILNSLTNVSVSTSTNALTISGPISGSAGLQFGNTGTLILTGANSYSGSTSVNGGLLIFNGTNTSASGNISIANNAAAEVGNGGTTGTLPTGSISDSGAFAFARSTALTVPNAISGNGEVDLFGSGAVILTGANSYTGTTTIVNGQLKIGSGGSLNSTGIIQDDTPEGLGARRRRYAKQSRGGRARETTNL